MAKIAKHVLECLSIHNLFKPMKKPAIKRTYRQKIHTSGRSEKGDWINVGNDLRKAISAYKTSVQQK